MAKKQKQLGKMAKSQKKKAKKRFGIFKPAKYKYISKIVSYKSEEKAEKSVKDLRKHFNEAEKKKKLRIFRATKLAETRANQTLKRKNLKPKTKTRFKKIAAIYGNEAKKMQSDYRRLA